MNFIEHFKIKKTNNPAFLISYIKKLFVSIMFLFQLN